MRTTLVSDVASAYFSLRRYDAQLEYSQKTLVANQAMLNLNTIKFKGGESPKTDVLQAQILVQQAEAQIISHSAVDRSRQRMRSASFSGGNPGPIARGISLTEQPHMPEIPSGLPSTLLERRPDVRQAEMYLVCGQCERGCRQGGVLSAICADRFIRRAEYFHTSFLEGPATFWSLAGHLLQPIFEGGRIRSNYALGLGQAR